MKPETVEASAEVKESKEERSKCPVYCDESSDEEMTKRSPASILLGVNVGTRLGEEKVFCGIDEIL